MKKAPSMSQNGSSVETVAGRSYISQATGSVSLSPNSSFPRLLAMADVFTFYRFTRIQVTLVPLGAEQVVCYINQGVDTIPATIPAAVEMPYMCYNSANQSTNSVMKLGRKELIGDNSIKWWKTIPGTPDAQWEIQGYLYNQRGTGSNIFLVEWEVEFSQWNLAGNSPMYVCVDSDTQLYKKILPAAGAKASGTQSTATTAKHVVRDIA